MAWHHNDLTVLAGAPTAVIGKNLDGYVTSFNDQQHINFLSGDNHVHELYYDGAWHHNDLTTLAGAPTAVRGYEGSYIVGYETSFNNQQHVIFIGNDAHVHELYYDGAWHHNDLTNLAGAPPFGRLGTLDGYQTSFNSQQHVNFIGDDAHVHELYYDGSWHHNDLTTLAGAPDAYVSTALDGYQTTFNNQQHINFIDGGGPHHVIELYYDGAWHYNDLTNLAAGAPPATQGTGLDGYETSFNNQQHVNFVSDADLHVQELYYDNAWHHNDLTQLTGAPVIPPDSVLDGYQTSFNAQQHINFIGHDGHVHELYYDGAWHHNDLTTLAGAPTAYIDTAVVGYQTAFNNQQHVIFIGIDSHVHELYYTD